MSVLFFKKSVTVFMAISAAFARGNRNSPVEIQQKATDFS